jgi:hypothetical protein
MYFYINLGGYRPIASLQKMSEPDYIARLQSLESMPTAQVLELLGFKRNRLGCYAHNWERLEVVAPEWFGGYHVLCTWWSANRRTLGIPEFKIPSKIAPACLLAILYKECGGAFQRGTLPLEFQIGKARYEFQTKIQSIIPPPPTIWAGRKFLRFCLSYLDKRADWAIEDYTIRLSAADNQLRFQGKSETVFCPVRGEWLGVSKVAARALFRGLPKRFSQPVVALQQEGNALRVDRHLIAAAWEDSS